MPKKRCCTVSKSKEIALLSARGTCDGLAQNPTNKRPAAQRQQLRGVVFHLEEALNAAA